MYVCSTVVDGMGLDGIRVLILKVMGKTNYDCPGDRCWRRAVVREPEFHLNFRRMEKKKEKSEQGKEKNSNKLKNQNTK